MTWTNVILLLMLSASIILHFAPSYSNFSEPLHPFTHRPLGNETSSRVTDEYSDEWIEKVSDLWDDLLSQDEKRLQSFKTRLAAVQQKLPSEPDTKLSEESKPNVKKIVDDGVLQLGVEPAGSVPDDYRYNPSRIMIIQMADDKGLAKYEHQLDSVKCWAERQGYIYVHAQPKDYVDCERIQKDWWHAQICVLHEVLFSRRDEIDYLVKIDGDVIGGVADYGLKHWIDGADMIVQERHFTAEINAGFYMIRNTEVGREIVKDWSEWTYKLKKGTGYNGMDNGTIHQVIIDALELEGRNECFYKYQALKSGSTMSQYFDFVACARRLLGPPRRHRNTYNGTSITVWPAGFGPMFDMKILLSYSPDITADMRNFHVLHHGVKDVKDPSFERFYGPVEEWGNPENEHCVKWELNPNNDTLGQKKCNELGLGYSRPNLPGAERVDTRIYLKEDLKCFDSFPANRGPDKPPGRWHYRVPRWNVLEKELSICLEDFHKCRPLDPLEEIEAEGYWCKESKAAIEGIDDEAELELKSIGKYKIKYEIGKMLDGEVQMNVND